MSLLSSEIADNPEFIRGLRHLAISMRQMFEDGPRLARLLASHQRWLLTQAAYALHLGHDPIKPSSGLTAVSLKEAIIKHRIASRNTVLTFLNELLSYKFIVLVPGEANRRPRRYMPAEASHAAMAGWFSANLEALDMLDDGDRADTLRARPDLLRLAQPRLANACVENHSWREPQERVALFLWTEAGGLVVDHLIARIPENGERSPRIDLGRIDTRAMATEFMMSRTHLQRLLRQAAAMGSVGWFDEARKTHIWLSQEFLEEYCQWQAIKFSLVDEAFEWARAQH